LRGKGVLLGVLGRGTASREMVWRVLPRPFWLFGVVWREGLEEEAGREMVWRVLPRPLSLGGGLGGPAISEGGSAKAVWGCEGGRHALEDLGVLSTEEPVEPPSPQTASSPQTPTNPA
jgi:hypothetical protein